MKSVMRHLSFGIALGLIALPSVLFGQSYCPQALMGQMNGSYYYNSQICGGGGCSTTHIATDAVYDCGGCCPNCCGTPCAEAILGLKATSPTAAPKISEKKAGDNGDNTFDVLCVHDRQVNFVDFSSQTGFKRPSKHITITQYKVKVTIPDKGDRFFYCIEAIHDEFPDKPLRIGQELDGDLPIPAGSDIQQITAARTKGERHYHRLKVAGNLHYDVLSVNDLGTQ